MLTAQDFIDAGYRKYSQHSLNHSDYLLQKRVDDPTGTKYFIQIWVYEHSSKDYYPGNPALPNVSFMPEVQFQRGDEVTMNITLILNDESTVQKIEQEFECLWLFLEKPYYSTY